MTTWLTTVRRRYQRTDTASETVAVLFTLPLLVALIFTLVEVGFRFSAQMSIQNTVRDLARTAAVQGGTKNLPARNDNTTEDLVILAETALAKCPYVGNCDPGSNVVSCTVPQGENVEKIGEAGTVITCNVTYSYSGVGAARFASGLGFWWVSEPIKVQAVSVSELGTAN